MSRRRSLASGLLAFGLCLGACTNNPYPDADQYRKTYYSAYGEAPRTLDPAVAYNVSAHAIIGNVYETLLEYHYLLRPYTLIPGIAREIPRPEPGEDGERVYRFRLRPGLVYQEDDCFELDGPGVRSREVTAADIAFELARLADPAVNSPVTDPFSNILGFREFRHRLQELREREPQLQHRPIREQYARAGGIEGVRLRGDYELEIVLARPYPQILYWFAMPFTSPVPWEAVQYYDGQHGRPRFADHPVGSGPYRLARYDKQFRIVLERNPEWYGSRHPEWHAPGAVYPARGEAGDAERGLLDPQVVGRPLPFLERIELWREKESIPRFNKFLQGYYDAQGNIVKESFDKVIQNDRLSPEMAARGIVLEKSVSPGVFYLGFNMTDPVVGAPAGERGRKLRQAMSLAVDSGEWIRLFLNSRGVPAQSPLPPGIFGYEEGYRNPYRRVDLDRARHLLAEAGYPHGVDPATGKPLRLTFDTYLLSSQQRLQDEYFVKSWRRIGIDVQVAGTTYNQFQQKVANGAYQIFQWGWQADYPDPENFLFLLTCDMRRSSGGGPNTSNFCDPRYDALFARMRVRENDQERLEVIRQMRRLLEEERPWIELFHREDYALYHGWLRQVKPFGMSYPMLKYRDIDVDLRARRRREWNRPVLWPAWALLGMAVALTLPGIVTFYRERQ